MITVVVSGPLNTRVNDFVWRDQWKSRVSYENEYILPIPIIIIIQYFHQKFNEESMIAQWNRLIPRNGDYVRKTIDRAWPNVNWLKIHYEMTIIEPRWLLRDDNLDICRWQRHTVSGLEVTVKRGIKGERGHNSDDGGLIDVGSRFQPTNTSTIFVLVWTGPKAFWPSAQR